MRCSVGIGRARGGRDENQDNFLVAADGQVRFQGAGDRVSASRSDGHGILIAVADGMGGHDQGDVASSAAVQALSHLWQLPPDQGVGPERRLATWLPQAHARIRAHAGGRGGRVNMGTTLTALWMVADRAGWVHVGDSRLYRRRGRIVEQLTRDQTHAEFAKRDQRDPGPHAAYPAQSFIYGSRGLGDDDALRLDPGQDTGTIVLLEGDRFMLCSDGVSNFLPLATIQHILMHTISPDRAADELVQSAMEGGSDDNVTALVVDVLELDASLTKTLPLAEDTLVPAE